MRKSALDAMDVKMYVRDGCRGGREQFKWDSLKEQEFKDREQYLGVSTKVGLMGKFGRYQVNDWYARKRDTAASIEEERGAVQKYEEELMQEALGLKPKKLLLAKRQLSEDELKEFLKKDADKHAEQQGRELMGPQKKTMTDAQGNEVEAGELLADGPTKGLGFAAHRNAKLEKYKAQVMGTESQLQGAGDVKFEFKAEMKVEVKDEPMDPARSSSSGAGLKEELKVEKMEMKEESQDADSEERRKGKKEKKLSKKQKKKEDKKLKKKVKKAAKKEKKAAKLAAKLASSRRQGANSRSRSRKRPVGESGSACSSSSSS